jgi:hypothetical protein
MHHDHCTCPKCLLSEPEHWIGLAMMFMVCLLTAGLLIPFR